MMKASLTTVLMPQGTKLNANTCSKPRRRQLESVHRKKLGQLSRVVTHSPTFKTHQHKSDTCGNETHVEKRHMWILFISHRTFKQTPPPPQLHKLPCPTGLSFLLITQGTINIVKARVCFLKRRHF